MRLKISWLLLNLAVLVKVNAYANEVEDEDASIENTENSKSLFYDSKIDADPDALYEKKREEKPTISEDAIFLPHETYCQYFYAFDGKDSYLYRCANGYRFDSESLQCVKTKNANCGKRKKNTGSSEEKKISINVKCTKWSGLSPHKHYCHLFYNCQYKKGTLFMCPPGKMFDTRTNLCLVQDRVKCDKRENPYVNDDLEDIDKPDTESDVTYYCPQSAGTFPDQRFCNKFIRCWYGIGQTYVCPKGKLYDEDLRKCRNRNSVYCNNRFDPYVVKDEEEPELVDENPQFFCFYYRGRYVHTDCRYFYQCENFLGRLYACPQGKLFDVNSQSCKVASEVDCNNRDTDNGNQDEEFVCPVREGTFKDDENCGSYYKCKNGKAERLQCPDGELFDTNWKSCNDENEVVCNDRLLPGDEEEEEENVIDENPKYNCEKPHGRFTHKEYCNWFYHCKDGKSSIRTCKKGRYYDSHRSRCFDEVDCGPRIPKEDYEVTTSKPREFVCPAKSGKFAHPRQCNAYYVCEKSKPKRHDCPKEKLFHERWGSCVEESKVTCGNRVHPDVYEEDDESKIVDENPKYECKVVHGNFENDEYCDWFYSCRDKKASLRECRKGKHYDSKSRRCQEQKNVSCGRRRRPEDRQTSTTEKAFTTREPEFRCRESHGKFPHPRDCGKFYECDKRYNHKEHKCPKKKLFDAKRKSCEDEDYVWCDSRIHPDMDPDEPEDVVVDDNPKYTCESNYGRFTNREFCHWYYNCHNKKASVRECRRGKYYDSRRRKCYDIEDVTCDERKKPKDDDWRTTVQQRTTQSFTHSTSKRPTAETRTSSTVENDNSSPHVSTTATEVTTGTTKVTTGTKEVTTDATEVTTDATELTTEATEVTTDATEVTTDATEVITDVTKSTTTSTDIVTTATGITTFETPSPTFEEDDNPDKIVDRNPNFNCDGDEGSFAHDSYCHYYYSCKNNKATLRECPEGKYFDIERGSCEDWYLVSCGERLTPEEIGSTFDDFQSTPYIKRTSITSRPEPSTSHEPVSTKKPSFICPTSDGAYPHERNCGKFYECINNVVEEKMCPEGQLYNVDKRLCYEEQETNCGKRIHPNDDPENPDRIPDKVVDPNPEFDCSDRHGCFTHERICKWYYYCHDKRAEVRECSGDTYFDSVRHKCLEWWMVFCGNRTTDDEKSTGTTPSDKSTDTMTISTEMSKMTPTNDRKTYSTERNTKITTDSGKTTKGTDTTESIFTDGSTFDKTLNTKVSDNGGDYDSTTFRLKTTPDLEDKTKNTDTTDISGHTESTGSRTESTEVTNSGKETLSTGDGKTTTPGTGGTGVTDGGKVTGTATKLKSTSNPDTRTESGSTTESILNSRSTGNGKETKITKSDENTSSTAGRSESTPKFDKMSTTESTESTLTTGFTDAVKGSTSITSSDKGIHTTREKDKSTTESGRTKSTSTNINLSTTSAEERTGTASITDNSKRTSLTTESTSYITDLKTETTRISGRDKSTKESGTKAKTTVTTESSFFTGSTNSETGKTYSTDREGTVSTKEKTTSTPEAKRTISTDSTQTDFSSSSSDDKSGRTETIEITSEGDGSTSYKLKTTPESRKETINTDTTESTSNTESPDDRTGLTKVTGTGRTSSTTVRNKSTSESGRETKTIQTTESNFVTRSTDSVTGKTGVTDESKETDSTAKRSTRDSESTTSLTTTEQPIIDKCKEEDGDFDHPDECKKYVTCKDGEYTVNECGDGTFFDVQTRICYREDLVDCGKRRKPEVTTDDCDEWLRTSTTSPDGNTSPPTKGTTGPKDEGTGGTEATGKTESPENRSSTSSDTVSEATKTDFTKSDETSTTESAKSTENNKLSTSSDTVTEYTKDDSTKFEKLISTENDKSTEKNKLTTSSDSVSENTSEDFTKSDKTSSTESDKSTENNKRSTTSDNVSEATKTDFTKFDETSSTENTKSTENNKLSTSSDTVTENTKDDSTKFEKLTSTENDKSTENNTPSTTSDTVSKNTREDFTKSDETSTTENDKSTGNDKLSTSSNTVSGRSKDDSTKFEKLISTETIGNDTEVYTSETTVEKNFTTNKPNTSEEPRKDTSSTKDLVTSSDEPSSTKDSKETTYLTTTENDSSNGNTVTKERPSPSTTIDAGENTDLTKTSTELPSTKDKEITKPTSPTENNFSDKSTMEKREPTPTTSTDSENTGLTKDQTSPSTGIVSTKGDETTNTITSGDGSSDGNSITESTNNPSTTSGKITDLTDGTSNEIATISTQDVTTKEDINTKTSTSPNDATTNEDINNTRTSTNPDGRNKTPTSEDNTESVRTTVDITDTSNTADVSFQTRVITKTKPETTPTGDTTTDQSLASSTDPSSTEFTTKTNDISETTHKHTTMHPCLTHTHSTPTLPTSPPKIDCNENDIDCIQRKTGDINKWFTCPEKQGYFPHPYTKRLFIRCNNGKPRSKKCGKHLAFSVKYMRCIRED